VSLQPRAERVRAGIFSCILNDWFAPGFENNLFKAVTARLNVRIKE
jgi:hypothetical protein